MSDENRKRELLPDVLRGFAVCLVILGHCIQEGSGEAFRLQQAYFDDTLYQLIYSFHMPLFMLVSGWLARYSMKDGITRRQQVEILLKRTKSLLIPIFGWTALDFIRIFVINEYKGYPHAAFMEGMIKYFLSAFENLWFLWAVFWCFWAVWLVHYWFHDSIWLYMIGFIAMFLIPDGLGLGAYKYMFPYYVAAFYLNGHIAEFDKKVLAHPRNRLFSMMGMGVFWIVLFIAFFEKDTFIYLSGYKLIGKNVGRQLLIDGYRMLVGFAGSDFFILLWREILTIFNKYHFPILARLGQDSMGIYAISGYILVLEVAALTPNVSPSYALNLAEMLIVLVTSAIITEMLGQIPAINRLVGK